MPRSSPWWLVCLIAIAPPPSVVRAQARATAKRDIYTVENAHFRIEVDGAAGARIRSWRLKPGGREMVALWKGRDEIGGVLDDRAFFTSVRYKASVVRPGPDQAVVRLEASHPSGLSVVKKLHATADSPVLRVSYEWRNGTQAAQRLFVRNFLLPGARPQTDRHRYWVSGRNERTGKLALDSPDAHGYYLPAEPAYAALWDAHAGDGVVAYAPGVSKFYFWRGSKAFPTFEWIYEDVPAGQVLYAEVALGVVCGMKAAPDWPAWLEARGVRVRRPALRPLAGWVDEATRFGVTPSERARGFWLSIGDGAFKRRPPEPWPVDLARDDDRYVRLTLNTTRDARVRLGVTSRPEAVGVFRETPGQDRRELLGFPEAPVALADGGVEHLWLRVSSRALEPGEHIVPVELRVGQASAIVRLRVTVWPVKAPTGRPFHVRGYCADIPCGPAATRLRMRT